ncbi:MAG TPA: DnaJ domain-containing protein [Halomonas sp.]|nr:DnaJ domain-containing protein [Halomonas sp.]
MTTARFSSFELLLLQSRHQADTAALLLLAWVLVNHGPLDESQRARLTDLTGSFRHGHDLEPILRIATTQDLNAIQLAAEVLQKEVHGLLAHPFLQMAIALSVDKDQPSTANQHVLRFLADLLGVSPLEFTRLFERQTGKALGQPPDPSRTAYWQAKEHHRGQREKQEHSRREEHHRERRQRREQGTRQGSPTGHERTRRALAVLGLEPGVSRAEIRMAYRRLAQAHHPDRFFHAGDAVVASASQRFQRIRRAYDFLMKVS